MKRREGKNAKKNSKISAMAKRMVQEIRGKLGAFTFLTVCLGTLHFFLEIFLLFLYFCEYFRLEMQGKYY